MRYLLVLLVAFWGSMASAQSDPTADIQSVIGGQLKAFQAQDVEKAWVYASPTIKMLFRDEQNFGVMVERGYPMVWNNADVRFLDLRTEDGRVWQKVRLTDRSGAVYFLDYQMIPTAQGWQINGVRVLDAPDVGA
ncbi:DUF4864 domain-containing protein [Nereida sp. MMG025]|uniref:DUF4864 domain-containing protein n=1 Tax=Nereida sp. MMG025 TaxID=2909981 RepID=UPI001F220EF4|nr:DUF4864 domain-containing protein [Nereida sp. MMG025]MCF6445573.1 DUF4864 domain-containing protein [Nereida sp. MMG025]